MSESQVFDKVVDSDRNPTTLVGEVVDGRAGRTAGWIPVEEQFPEEGQRVLFAVRSNHMYGEDSDYGGVLLGFAPPDPDYPWYFDGASDGISAEAVTHWMPVVEYPDREEAEAPITDPSVILDAMRRVVLEKRNQGERPTDVITQSPEMRVPASQAHLPFKQDSYEFRGRLVDHDLGDFLHEIGYLRAGRLTWKGFKGPCDQWLHPTPDPFLKHRE